MCPAIRSGRSEKYRVCWFTFTSRKVLLAASTLRSSALCTNMSCVLEEADGTIWAAAVDSIAAAKRNAVSVYFTHLYVLLVVFMNHFSFCFRFAASQSLNQFHRSCTLHFVEADLRFALRKLHRVQ